MGRNRKGWYERTQEKKVTLDWLATNCNLTPRESELLQLVHERKMVRRNHLEIISPSYRHLGDNRTQIINRAITKLFRQMIFDKVHEPQKIGEGNTPCIVALDRGGSLLLSVKHKARIIQSKSSRNGQDYITRRLPANYRHVNGVNQMEVDTILFSESTGHDILSWKIEPSTSFIWNNEKQLFIPDVLFEMQIKHKKLIVFLEYDTGKEDLRNKKDFPTIHEKLKEYRKYKLSDLWKEELAYFPLILFVTEDMERVKWITAKCKELNLKGYGVYHENYTDVLERLANMV